MSRRLVRDLIINILDNEFLRPMADGAVLPDPGEQIVVSTDSFVVSPLFFPGGDIGKLAVFGTVNDLSVSGAESLYLTLGMIIEEGLPLEILQRLLHSIRDAAYRCGILIVAGDTKVVPRGAADGLFLNTTGIGRLRCANLGPHRLRVGDRILISGTLADHGVAVLAAREKLDLGDALLSDCAPINDFISALLAASVDIHFMRDPTRGGVSATLHELAQASGLSVIIDETSLPLSDAVRGACEILGLDPLYVANEGKLLLVVTEADAPKAVEILRAVPHGHHAAIIGSVTADGGGEVLIRTCLGALRHLDEPTGAPLPRIC
jgi:hydrogenase expression/formation protein HypE